MREYLASQFGHPRGVVGRVIGWLMAAKNTERTAWTVLLLEIRPQDHVLEIGFGPGVGVQRAAALAAQGRVAGIDHSAAMVAEAMQRNRALVRAGRLELQHGSVAALPYPDDQFDKALAINSLRFWPQPVENLREVRRVLRPGGRLAITEQPMGAGGDAEVPALRERLRAQLAEAGFREIRIETRAMRPAPSVCSLGLK